MLERAESERKVSMYIQRQRSPYLGRPVRNRIPFPGRIQSFPKTNHPNSFLERTKIEDWCRELGGVGYNWVPLLAFYCLGESVFYTKGLDPRGFIDHKIEWTWLRSSEVRPFATPEMNEHPLKVKSLGKNEEGMQCVQIDYIDMHRKALPSLHLLHMVETGNCDPMFNTQFRPLPAQFFTSAFLNS